MRSWRRSTQWYVYSSSHLWTPIIPLTLAYSKKRTVAAVDPQITKTNITTPHLSPNPSTSISNNSLVTNRTPSSNSPAALVEELIPMQRMAAMRTTSLCGILAIKPRIKASKVPKPKVPQARDVITCVIPTCV